MSLLNDLLNESCLRELNLVEGEKVLDLGSGLGQFTRRMAQKVGGNGQVVGIERDRDQIAQAKRLANIAGQSVLVEFRQGDVFELPLGESEWGSFDVAHARFLLEHVPRPELVIAEMVRSVRPGGRVFVADDDHDNFRPWPEPAGFDALWRAYVRSYERAGNDPYVGRRLVSLLHGAGLTAIRNSCVFFGGSAGDERFEAVADNIIGTLGGAKDAILSDESLDEESFRIGMEGLESWKADPSAALWYTVCCAEGTSPS